jgi:hypothetical protein
LKGLSGRVFLTPTEGPMITTNLHDVTGIEFEPAVLRGGDGVCPFYWRRELVARTKTGERLELTLFADSEAALLLPGEKSPEPEKVSQIEPQEPETSFNGPIPDLEPIGAKVQDFETAFLEQVRQTF